MSKRLLSAAHAGGARSHAARHVRRGGAEAVSLVEFESGDGTVKIPLTSLLQDQIGNQEHHQILCCAGDLHKSVRVLAHLQTLLKYTELCKTADPRLRDPASGCVAVSSNLGYIILRSSVDGNRKIETPCQHYLAMHA